MKSTSMMKSILALVLASSLVGCTMAGNAETDDFSASFSASLGDSMTLDYEFDEVLGDCATAAFECAFLYTTIHTRSWTQVADACDAFDTGCAEGLCRHKENADLVRQVEGNIEPVVNVDSATEQITLSVTGSIDFKLSRSEELECVSPITYQDLKDVSMAVWQASNCITKVSEICAAL